MKIKEETLLKLYENYQNIEHFYIETHQKRIQFFTAFIGTIFVASIGATINAKLWWHYLIIILGPILIISICNIGKKATKRLYLFTLEAVISKVKIEQLLGLTESNIIENKKTNRIWENEPIIITHKIIIDGKHKTSEDFINKTMKHGYQKLVDNLFSVFQILNILLIIGLIMLSIYNK